MMKTFSVAELGHGAASRAIREAQQEPVLVSKENKPAAWIIGAEKLAEVMAARGLDRDVYQYALERIAVDLYDSERLSLGQAAKLAGLSMNAFIDLCAGLNVPILRGTIEEVERDVAALETLLDETSVEVVTQGG